MLPPLPSRPVYRQHPRMQEILEEKRRRREDLLLMEQKHRQELIAARREILASRQSHNEQIERVSRQISEKKRRQHEKILSEQKNHAGRIWEKKAERLLRYLPERKPVIEMLRKNFMESLKEKQADRQGKLRELAMVAEEKLLAKQRQELSLSERIRGNGLVDVNDGECVICLSQDATIYMKECKHLVCCSGCEFIIRMQKKCPICRRVGQYKNLIKKARFPSLQK